VHFIITFRHGNKSVSADVAFRQSLKGRGRSGQPACGGNEKRWKTGWPIRCIHATGRAGSVNVSPFVQEAVVALYIFCTPLNVPFVSLTVMTI
jgi:hypothetical protein